jgi:tRNA pseudouridine55 synthase
MKENPSIHRFPRPLPGVHLLHKPVGATSFSLVKGVQDALSAVPGKAFKVCHAGALDPFAEGLLPVLVGPVTKLFDSVHELPKTYLAQVKFGRETDSGDALGRTTREAAVPTDEAALDAALQALVGWHEQVPPPMSNKRVDGERAYALAHAGVKVELPPSRVYLHSVRRTSGLVDGAVAVELVCRGGYYVRSFARDLGVALQSAAHVVTLHRTHIGPWTATGAVVHGRALWSWLPTRELDDAAWGRVKQGVPAGPGRVIGPTWRMPEGFPPVSSLCRAFHQDRLVALLDEQFQAKVLLPTGC